MNCTIMGLEKNQVGSSTIEMDLARNSGSQFEDESPCQAVVKRQTMRNKRTACKAQELILVLSLV